MKERDEKKMSKSIFEEAIEIIDRNTFELGKGLDVLGVNDRSKIEHALQQAQKQEKLLELYKEALETNFEGITLIKLVNKTLRTQIKELENE